ncbi:MAG: PAS domain-containing sensor histidine kinase [Cyanobium sp. NAT70]|nr:PAS domain-containing sensor histidine kinase [Cyanobium sp. NAT70]|tara:strand:+ start:94 stop:1230 length:1137 start_codon:yes stop_codon:yes gene_type:complete
MTFTVVGLLLGVVLTLSVQRWSRRRQLMSDEDCPGFAAGAINTPQLLAWIDAATQGWMILAPDLTIAYINARAERLLHLSRNLLVRGLHLDQVLSIPQLDEAIVSTRHLQRPQRSEWHQLGEPLEAFVLPGTDEWLLVLIQSRQSLEAQQQQQERWVGDVAHELKTPLTALMLVSDRLEMAVDGKDTVLVQRLQRELHRLQQMVNDLLELSRLENCLPQDSGSYTLLTLEDLVDSAWSSIRPLAEQRQVTLDLDRSESGPLMGDQSRLHRAVLNLLDNALRYSPNGGLVEVEVLPSGGWWLLTIRDHGPGLSESDLGKMFHRFYRGDPSRSRAASTGSGLGLAIVQQIAVNHGGRVEARNHPDGGTCLELLLPKSLPE